MEEILGLKQEDNQERLAELKRIAAIAENAKTGMLCRKCFLSLSRYQQLKSSLLTNIDLVISSHHAHHTAGFKRVKTAVRKCPQEPNENNNLKLMIGIG